MLQNPHQTEPGGLGSPRNGQAVAAGPAERRRVTISDVARGAGVSITVVSHALGGYGRVAPATRERVVRLAQELGYHPSARARALKLGRAGAARCAVVSFGRDADTLSRLPFYSAILAGIALHAADEGMDVHLVSAPAPSPESGGPDGVDASGRDAAAGALSRFVAADRADGCILLAGPPIGPDAVAPLVESGMPFVLVNRHFGETPVNCVVFDKGRSNREAVRHLAALGHRRIVLLLPEQETSNVTDRRLGWSEGVRDCGIDPQDAPVLRYGGGCAEVERTLTPRLLAEGLPHGRGIPTAILAFDDDVAAVVLRAAARAGVAVPERLSVIGFTNILAPYTTPALCSHELYPVEAGKAAAQLLARLVRREVTAPQRIVFTPTFVCRDSCGPAPVDC